MQTEIDVNESEIPNLNESEKDLNECENDLNECEHFLKHDLDRCEIANRVRSILAVYGF